MKIFCRAGINDGYTPLWDLSKVAEYLNQMEVVGPLRRIGQYQFETSSHHDYDCITLYHAANSACPLAEITSEELRIINSLFTKLDIKWTSELESLVARYKHEEQIINELLLDQQALADRIEALAKVAIDDILASETGQRIEACLIEE